MKRRLAEFTSLTAAERRLRDEIGAGGLVRFGDGAVPPEGAGDDRRISADFLRYLMLGGCEDLPKPVPETGVQIMGARIAGTLNLEGADCPCNLVLIACRLDDAPILLSATIGGLYLDGTTLPGLRADGLTTRGNVHLRGVTATGELRLLGARIGGNLSCIGAELTAVLTEGKRGRALNADGAEVTGGFFLRKLKLPDGQWRSARIDGVLDLTAARLGWINDEAASWPAPGNLILERCRYGAFIGKDVTAGARLDWLGRQDWTRWDKDFWPQPWEQCAKVFREMGHGEDAKKILIDKERRQRKARRARSPVWRRFYQWPVDWLMAVSTRYGRRPMLAFLWLLVAWGGGVAVFGAAWGERAFKPNTAFVLRSAEWFACDPAYSPAPDGPPARWDAAAHGSQLDCYLDQPEARAYPRFNALVYSADTLLPIVAMEMQEFWIPDERRGTRGVATRVWLWAHIALGWGLSLLAVAGFSGLIKTDNTT